MGLVSWHLGYQKVTCSAALLRTKAASTLFFLLLLCTSENRAADDGSVLAGNVNVPWSWAIQSFSGPLLQNFERATEGAGVIEGLYIILHVSYKVQGDLTQKLSM